MDSKINERELHWYQKTAGHTSEHSRDKSVASIASFQNWLFSSNDHDKELLSTAPGG